MKTIIDYNKIYDSNNYGKYKILREIEPVIYSNGTKSRMVEVQFIQTGTIVRTKLSHAIYDHAIKDKFYPSVYGVGYIGNSTMGIEKIYKCWSDMIARCYNTKYEAYRYYGAIGVSVDERWHCYESFAFDVQYLPGYYNYINYSGFVLDKDLLQSNVRDSDKIYSKETCCFIPLVYNAILSRISVRDISRSVGVRPTPTGSKFTARIKNDNKEIYLGAFDAPEYAEAMYDHYAKLYHHDLLNNNGISIIEALRHKYHKNPTIPICSDIMCKIIK